jgi:hypothetical protein
MSAATIEGGSPGGPFKGIIGRHFGYTGDPAVIAQTPGTGYALLVEGVPVATSRTLIVHTATMLVSAGAVTLANTQVGDKVVSVTDLTGLTDASASFETTITVAGQIQQTGAGTAGHVLLAAVQPQS